MAPPPKWNEATRGFDDEGDGDDDDRRNVDSQTELGGGGIPRQQQLGVARGPHPLHHLSQGIQLLLLLLATSRDGQLP